MLISAYLHPYSTCKYLQFCPSPPPIPTYVLPTSSSNHINTTARELVIDTRLGVCRDRIKPYGPIDNLEVIHIPAKPGTFHLGTRAH